MGTIIGEKIKAAQCVETSISLPVEHNDVKRKGTPHLPHAHKMSRQLHLYQLNASDAKQTRACKRTVLLTPFSAFNRYAYSQVAEATVGTPFFAPRNAPREVPKGRLFGMQIHRGDLKALEVIGAGQFGAVYLATQNMRRCPGCAKDYAIDGHLKRCLEKCAPSITYDASKVEKHDVTRAVKMLKGVANAAAKKEFFDEANVMLMFDHPNVTNIMGVAVQQAPWLYVLEYCMYVACICVQNQKHRGTEAYVRVVHGTAKSCSLLRLLATRGKPARNDASPLCAQSLHVTRA